jgi:hypothetical protein
MNVLLLRPYYGGNICGDMSGDLGLSDFINHVYPDLHLVNTASILKSLNCGVTVIDANGEKKLPHAVTEAISDSYDVILLSAKLSSVKLDIEFARCLKKIFPKTRVIIAGSIATILGDWLKTNVPEIEIATTPMIEDFACELATGEKRHLALNEMPKPDYSLFPYTRYINSRGQQWGVLNTSIGCRINCDYCPYAAYYKGIYEERDPGKLADDLEFLSSLGMHYISFRDQNFCFKKERVLAICKTIKDRNIKIRWETETRIDVLDKEMMDAMAEAGAEMLSFGIESPSKETLKKFNRPILNESKYLENIAYLKGKKIKTLAFFIMGFPGETWEDMTATYGLARSLETTYANFNVWNPHVRTKSFEKYARYNPVTPDLFSLFKRNINVDIPDRLNPKEKPEFATQYFSYKYIEEMDGIEGLYGYKNMEDAERKRNREGYAISVAFIKEHLSDCTLQDTIAE